MRRAAAEISSIRRSAGASTRSAFVPASSPISAATISIITARRSNTSPPSYGCLASCCRATPGPTRLRLCAATIPSARRVLDAVKGNQLKVSFGLDPELDVHPVNYTAGTDGIRASVAAFDKRIEMRLPLLGEINLLKIQAPPLCRWPWASNGCGRGRVAAMPRGPRQIGGGARSARRDRAGRRCAEARRP